MSVEIIDVADRVRKTRGQCALDGRGPRQHRPEGAHTVCGQLPFIAEIKWLKYGEADVRVILIVSDIVPEVTGRPHGTVAELDR